jgi:hypothetical protein
MSPRSMARNTADAISSRSSSDGMHSSNAAMTCDSMESASIPRSSSAIVVLPWIVNPFMLARSTPLLAKVIPSTSPHCRNVMTSQGEFPASDLINEKAAGPSVGPRPVLRMVVLRDWPGVYVPRSRCRQRFGLVFPPANDTMDVRFLNPWREIRSMSIHAVCECGKKFEAKDEYEGRRAICPSCKREFVFQRGGIPVFHEVVEPRPQPTIQIDDDALPGVTTLKVTPAAKTRWRGSIAMTPRTIAAVVSVTVLGCLAVSYYRATQPAKDPPGLKEPRLSLNRK